MATVACLALVAAGGTEAAAASSSSAATVSKADILRRAKWTLMMVPVRPTSLRSYWTELQNLQGNPGAISEFYLGSFIFPYLYGKASLDECLAQLRAASEAKIDKKRLTDWVLSKLSEPGRLSKTQTGANPAEERSTELKGWSSVPTEIQETTLTILEELEKVSNASDDINEPLENRLVPCHNERLQHIIKEHDNGDPLSPQDNNERVIKNLSSGRSIIELLAPIAEYIVNLIHTNKAERETLWTTITEKTDDDSKYFMIQLAFDIRQWKQKPVKLTHYNVKTKKSEVADANGFCIQLVLKNNRLYFSSAYFQAWDKKVFQEITDKIEAKRGGACSAAGSGGAQKK